jgi:hypothetical protein
MPTMMGLPRWVVISTASTVVAVTLIALAVLFHAGKQDSNPFGDLDELMPKAEVRRILGPPDTVEVQEGPVRPLPIGPPRALVKAACWSYGPKGEVREAKLCFGQTGTLVRVEQ